MIDYTTVRSLIETRLSGVSSIPPVIFENTETDVPDHEHISLVDEDVNSIPAAIGSLARMVHGRIIISIFTKQGTGTNTARQIASLICKSLREWGNDTISVMGEEEFFSVGKVENSNMYQHNLIVPYTYQYG